MLARTHISEAPWWIVDAVDKKRARLNWIHHFLQQIPYGDVPREMLELPPCGHSPNYVRAEIPHSLYVPQAY